MSTQELQAGTHLACCLLQAGTHLACCLLQAGSHLSWVRYCLGISITMSGLCAKEAVPHFAQNLSCCLSRHFQVWDEISNKFRNIRRANQHISFICMVVEDDVKWDGGYRWKLDEQSPVLGRSQFSDDMDTLRIECDGGTSIASDDSNAPYTMGARTSNSP